jgi:ElaB/YqjD/DUF883 family membrane-anchored ribosome-binding protein
MEESMNRQDTLADTAERKAHSAVENVANRAEEAATSARDVAQNFGDALDESLAKQPMTTLAFAVALGFILGALWKA